MVEFFKRSFRNIAKATLIIFGVFLVVLIIAIGALVLFKENFPSLTLNDILLGLGFNFGLAFFIMILAFLVEYKEYAAYRFVLSRNPFNRLSEIHFREVTLFNQRFPWKLYKPVMIANAGNFIVVADTKSRSWLTISYLAWNINGVNFHSNIENHREIKFSSSESGVALQIPVDSFGTPGLEGLKKILTGVVPVIQQLGYTPMHDLSVYEKVLKNQMIQQGFSGG
jgi:hypothetical protein